MLILCERFCEYSTSMLGYSKDTIRRYRFVIRYFRQFARIENIAEVTDTNVRELFYNGRLERKWSANTFIVYHKTLRVFFRWCVKEGYMASNPLTDIEMPKLGKRLPGGLTKQNAARLLEVVYNYPYGNSFLRSRNHAIFATFMYAGLRKQELLNLKFTDIDLDNLTLFVRRGKGDKDRIVPISYSLAQSLKRYLVERKKMNTLCPEFFASTQKGFGLTDNGLKWLVRKVQSAAKIKFSVHKLRHTFATLMLEGGCDIFSLSRMMGHSNIQTTTIYLAASMDHLRNQITKHPLN